MSLVVCPDANMAAMYLADLIEKELLAKPSLVLGLATGRTPALAYDELVRRYHTNQRLTFRFCTTFNTDEFVGMGPRDPRSARFFMNTHLFKLVDMSLEQTHVPRGDAHDLEQECKAYEAFIKANGGLDLVVLGLGHNGHIGFNEPGSTVKSRTRQVEFTASTIAALSDGERFRSVDETPTQALTMGLATILEAKHILLIATGIGKRQALHRIFDGRPGPAVPASLLRSHPRFTVVVDQDAASGLKDSESGTTYVARDAF